MFRSKEFTGTPAVAVLCCLCCTALGGCCAEVLSGHGCAPLLLTAAAMLAVGAFVTLRQTCSMQRGRRAAQEASSAKTEFLANMSHEIRAPLSGIVRTAELLERTPLAPEQHELVQAIVAGSETLIGILDEVLDFSRMEKGAVRVNCVPVNVRGVLDELAHSYSARAEAKRLKFSVFLAPAAPQVIGGDAVRLRQILDNLLSNAVKFTDRGEVRLEVTPVGEPKQTGIAFRVRDTGIGIDADHIEKLFGPFVQAGSAAGRKYGGMGLGLAIARRLVMLMGGSMGADSRSGQGSTFWFVLPVREAQQAGERPPEPCATRKERGLVAEATR